MSRRVTPASDLDQLTDAILSNRKYRQLGIPRETVRSLLEQALERRTSLREAVDDVRARLHNIVAPYLGDPDYAAEMLALAAIDQPKDLKTFSQRMLGSHASTRERLPLLPEFYPRLWQVTGEPQSVLDLACGLNPFSLPWMALPQTTSYFAYDLHAPRIDLINKYLMKMGRPPSATVADILLHPPQQTADVALFFKEAHRFEQRQKGCNRLFWQALNVRWLLVSLPTENLTGTHSKVDQHRSLVTETLAGLDWHVTEILFPGELVFCIRTQYGT